MCFAEAQVCIVFVLLLICIITLNPKLIYVIRQVVPSNVTQVEAKAPKHCQLQRSIGILGNVSSSTLIKRNGSIDHWKYFFCIDSCSQKDEKFQYGRAVAVGTEKGDNILDERDVWKQLRLNSLRSFGEIKITFAAKDKRQK